MNRARKRSLLALALLGTVTAAWFAPPEVPAAPAQPRSARAGAARPAQAAPAVPQLDVLRIRARDAAHDDEQADGRLFAPAPWSIVAATAPLAAPEPQAAPAAPAQAPPLPFRVLGQYEEAGRTVVFLQHGELNVLARVGDTIAEHYKVDSLQGNSMTLRYIPLDQLQTLEVGGR